MAPELLAAFGRREDLRNRPNGRHPLPVLLFIAWAMILGGGETCADMELFARAQREFRATFLPLRHGAPRPATFSWVFRRRNPAAFERWLLSFRQQFAAAGGGRRGRQDLAPVLRPGRRASSLALGQPLGARTAVVLGTGSGSRQIQRNHGLAPAAGVAGPEGRHRNGGR